MSSNAFETVASNWGDAAADRVRRYLEDMGPGVPIRLRHAAEIVDLSRSNAARILETLVEASVLRSEQLLLCVECDEPVESGSECDICGGNPKPDQVETCYFVVSTASYEATTPQVLFAAEGGSWDLPPPPRIEDASWDEVAQLLPVDALIMTAVKVEWQAAITLMTAPPGFADVLRAPFRESTYYFGRIGSYTCALVMSDAGSDGRQGAALTLHDATARLTPSFAVAVGIAFGGENGKNKQRLGDVLISTIVIPYDSERVQPAGDIPRAPHPEAGLVLLNRLRALDAEDGVDAVMRFGPLLSGAKLVDDSGFKAELLKKHPTAIGGEMEAVGMYAAAARNRLEWVVIKAICDWADGKKDKKHQKRAAMNACRVLGALLNRRGLEQSVFSRNGSSLRQP
jgi:nucleoside phosphorylase